MGKFSGILMAIAMGCMLLSLLTKITEPDPKLVEYLSSKVEVKDSVFMGKEAKCYKVSNEWGQAWTAFFVQNHLVVFIETVGVGKNAQIQKFSREDDEKKWNDWYEIGRAVIEAEEKQRARQQRMATPTCCSANRPTQIIGLVLFYLQTQRPLSLTKTS